MIVRQVKDRKPKNACNWDRKQLKYIFTTLAQVQTTGRYGCRQEYAKMKAVGLLPLPYIGKKQKIQAFYSRLL
jgi:hypothetical protein